MALMPMQSGTWHIASMEGDRSLIRALALLTVIGFTSNEPQRYWGEMSASRKSPVMCSRCSLPTGWQLHKIVSGGSRQVPMLEVIVLSRVLLRCHCRLCGFWSLGCLSSPTDV